MSQENVELVMAGYQAFNRRDFDAALELAHDSITWKPFFSVEADVLRGKEAVLAAWKSQIEALDLRIEPLELKALDGGRVLAVAKWRAHGSGSGASVEQTSAQVFTIENGRVRSVETYASRDAALEAVELPD